MLGGLVTAVVVITLDALLSGQESPDGSESTVDIDTGTYLLCVAVVLAVFGAIRGGKPVNTPEPDSVTPQAQPD